MLSVTNLDENGVMAGSDLKTFIFGYFWRLKKKEFQKSFDRKHFCFVCELCLAERGG